MRGSQTCALAALVVLAIVSAHRQVAVQEPSTANGPKGLAKSSWPKFGGDAQNTWRGGGSGANGALRWQFVAEGNFGDEQSPAIDEDGTVYVGAMDGKLYALDGENGRCKWAFQTLRGKYTNVRTTPAVGADGTVYFGCWNNRFYALDGATGKQKWEFVTKGPVWVISPAIGTDGTVYAGSYSDDRSSYKLYALDGNTGKKKWEIDGGVGPIGRDGTIYVGTQGGGSCALDGATGEKKWTIDKCSIHSIGPDGTLYGRGPNFSTCALDPSKGTEKWRFTPQGSNEKCLRTAIGVDGTVYIPTYLGPRTRSDGKLYALEGKSGNVKWETRLPQPTYSHPAIAADGTLYVVTGKHVYALDGKTGEAKWDWEAPQQPGFSTGFGVGASPAIGADGTIYIGASMMNRTNHPPGVVFAIH